MQNTGYPQPPNYKAKNWSVPPVSTTEDTGYEDISIDLTQGQIYKIDSSCKTLTQNIMSEVGYDIEWSFHGKFDGKWFVMPAGSFLEVTGCFYLLNRNWDKNIPVAISSIL